MTAISEATRMIPVGVVRPIAEAWVAEFDAPENAFHRLAANSDLTADAWRKRFTELVHRSKRTGSVYPQGWWSFEELPDESVDEFLTAAELTHLWYEQPLAASYTAAHAVSDDDFDATCAVCGGWLDWENDSVAGVRLELTKRSTRNTSNGGIYRYAWWSLCACCAADELPIPVLRGASGNVRRLPDAELRRLYKLYVNAAVGLEGGIAATVWRGYGFASEKSCACALAHVWRAQGLPLRSRSEGKRLNAKLRKPSTGRLSEKQVRQAYLLHTRRDMSLNQLGRQLHREFGYKTHSSCAAAIGNGFRALGLTVRDRIEMCVVASTTNGLSPRDAKLRRRRRVEAGFTTQLKPRQPKCGEFGHVSKRGRKGLPCERPVITGKSYCEGHNPATLAARCERLAAGRAKAAVKWEPAAELTEALLAWKEMGGTWRELAPLADVPDHYLAHVVAGEFANVSKERAARIRAALEEVTRDRSLPWPI